MAALDLSPKTLFDFSTRTLDSIVNRLGLSILDLERRRQGDRTTWRRARPVRDDVQGGNREFTGARGDSIQIGGTFFRLDTSPPGGTEGAVEPARSVSMGQGPVQRDSGPRADRGSPSRGPVPLFEADRPSAHTHRTDADILVRNPLPIEPNRTPPR